jgi:hypothetical protein
MYNYFEAKNKIRNVLNENTKKLLKTEKKLEASKITQNETVVNELVNFSTEN